MYSRTDTGCRMWRKWKSAIAGQGEQYLWALRRGTLTKGHRISQRVPRLSWVYTQKLCSMYRILIASGYPVSSCILYTVEYQNNNHHIYFIYWPPLITTLCQRSRTLSVWGEKVRVKINPQALNGNSRFIIGLKTFAEGNFFESVKLACRMVACVLLELCTDDLSWRSSTSWLTLPRRFSRILERKCWISDCPSVSQVVSD